MMERLEELGHDTMTTHLDKVEACKVFGYTGFPHHSSAFAHVFRLASHETDEDILKCYFEIYKSTEWPDVRRDLAATRRLTIRRDQSTKENQADLFNIKSYDYALRRFFCVCYLVGLVDGTAEDLRSFRVHTSRTNVGFEKIKVWTHSGFDDVFIYDHWDIEDDEDEVVEILHGSRWYVRHLWRSKGFPDLKVLKVDWLRAASILEKCESIHPAPSQPDTQSEVL